MRVSVVTIGSVVVVGLGVLGASCTQRSAPPAPPPPPPHGYGYGYGPPPQYGAPAPAPAPAPAYGAPCAPENSYDCTADRRALTSCRGGRSVIVSTCRGVRGCVVGNAIDCDHSVAAVGDPCDGPKEIACSLDKTQMLRCANGVYQFAEACRNACLGTSGRILCQ